MANFLTYQIILGNVKYAVIIAKFPAQQSAIDAKLSEMGWMIDSTGNCVAKAA